MREDDIVQPGKENQSYAEILREIGSSTTDLVQSEVALVTAELKDTARVAGRHISQTVIFGALLALSVFPFLAFLVIGLGNMVGGRYWLSSLIVAVICAVVGGRLAFKAYQKLKSDNFSFSHTRGSLKGKVATVQAKVNEVKDAAKGEHYGSDRLH